MLTEREKAEMLEAAASPSLREDFERMDRARVPVGIDQYIRFLSDFTRLFGAPSRRTPPASYSRILI
ncbi:MAG TPA: hypothetical protein DCM05_08800 [Elusimicrobia bacterium]|nr:hypothetical protein [Elusimicrobiota bacterium]